LKEEDVLELYHNINSVCAQKVRIALKEKGEEVKEHLLTLQGDQNDPVYMKLNPNGVVPTLVHDGNVIIESSLILYYIDDAFPDPPLMPRTPVARHRVRLYNKLIDEYMHNACTIMTFATAFRPRFLKMAREQWLAEINKAPLKRRAEYKRSVIEHGLDSEFVIDALGQHRKMISWMADDLTRGPYLAGDTFTNADCAVIPYILRLELLKLGAMWQHEPAIVDWWAACGRGIRSSPRSSIACRTPTGRRSRTLRPIPGQRCRRYCRRRDPWRIRHTSTSCARSPTRKSRGRSRSVTATPSKPGSRLRKPLRWDC
jgi:glutathione S-transferase